MNDEVEQIKERVDIIELISSYLTLKKAGSNMKALCPFHTEKTPSFMVSPERQTFKCFGCGIGGDVFTFIEKIEGLDFYNSLKVLADRSGIKLKQRGVKYGDKEYQPDQKTKLYQINALAAKVYHKILSDHPKADKARAYLRSRGVNDETIKNFQIGYAPNSWDFLIRFLKSRKFTKDDAFKAGLLSRNERGDCYDRFRGRIIFPINDILGNPIAFTSRVLVDDGKQAKYINSADSPIYHKGKVLYGLDRAKLAIREKDQVVLVEGNMDVVACHQAGFKNVVASSGTAITEEQLKILNRYTSEIAFCFDRDSAGEAAMKRAVTLALKNDISAKIVVLPEPFKDADEAISADKKNWDRALLGTKSAIEYWIDILVGSSDALSISDKKRIAKEILPVIKISASEIEKEHYLKCLSKKIVVSESALVEALKKSKEVNIEGGSEISQSKDKREMTLYERIAGVVWSFPELCQKGQKVGLEKLEIENKTLKKFFDKIAEGEIEPDKFLSEEKSYFDQLAFLIESDFDQFSKGEAEKELLYLLGALKRKKREKIKSEYAQKIEQAEAGGDKNKVKELVNEFSKLIK